MNQLRRFYNQNRKKIWRIIIIIVFAFAMLQTANFYAKKKNEEKIQMAMTKQENLQNGSEDADETYISSNSQSNKASQKNKTSVINEFVKYCNNKEFENAYNMLTDDCKNEIFQDIETFIDIYYNEKLEATEKAVEIDKWANNTYLVKFTEDALSTGRIASTIENQTIDYITVVEDGEGNYKLNVNSYIGYKEINDTKEDDEVTFEVLGKNIYKDYETYTIKITNKSNGAIVLDSLENSENIYIEDSKGVKYPAYSSMLSKGILTVGSGYVKQLNIRFLSNYVTTKNIKRIVFSDYYNKNNQKKTISIDF